MPTSCFPTKGNREAPSAKTQRERHPAAACGGLGSIRVSARGGHPSPTLQSWSRPPHRPQPQRRGAAQEGEGDAGPAPGSAGQAPMRGQAVGVLRSREVEKRPAHSDEGAGGHGGCREEGAEPAGGGARPGEGGPAAGELGPRSVGYSPSGFRLSSTHSIPRTHLPPGLRGPPGTHSPSGPISGRQP